MDESIFLVQGQSVMLKGMGSYSENTCLHGKSHLQKLRVFHGLSEVLREAIVTVAMKDAPLTRKKNNDAIQLQATAQRMKVELFKGEKSGMCNGSIYRWLVLISNVFLTGVLER